MLTIALIVGVAYFLIAIILTSAVKKDSTSPSEDFRVSLIIPARNEGKDLPRCLDSIEKLRCPEDNLQVILIDHGSQDNTLKLMKDFKRKSRFRVDIITVEYDEESSCKAEALRMGIETAEGEVLAFADAEANFGPDWLQGMMGYIKSGFQLVAGPVLIEGEEIFAQLQRYDWLFLCAVGAGFAGLKMPQSAFGKNLVITKDLYQKAGGFPRGRVWTEDLELLKRCRGLGKIGFTMFPQCAVSSLPMETLKDFFRQRMRWLKGGLSCDAPGLIAMGAALLMDVFIIVGIFTSLKLLFPLLLIKFASDWIIMNRHIGMYGLKATWKTLPLYTLFSVFYHLALLAMLPAAKNLRWR